MYFIKYITLLKKYRNLLDLIDLDFWGEANETCF